ncbi:MAG: hypothetical protein H0X14_02460 [Acidobacteria bacterium]|nr:hypothetical protein [Acidobacteriota bacterium]
MPRRTILALSVLLVCALTALSGTNAGKTATADPQESINTPPQANNAQPQGGQDVEKDKVKPKRSIQMTIMTKGSNYEPKSRYKVGDKVLIEVTMTNTGAEPLEVGIGNSYFQNRPRMRKDGKPVQYRKELPDVLKEKEKRPGQFGSAIYYKLEPNVPTVVHRFLLEDWYGQLDPGQYEFALRHRFWGKEVPAESDTVTFEVVP